jgi:hypothetical protein
MKLKTFFLTPSYPLDLRLSPRTNSNTTTICASAAAVTPLPAAATCTASQALAAAAAANTITAATAVIIVTIVTAALGFGALRGALKAATCFDFHLDKRANRQGALLQREG